jgi:hypothetical protein
LARRSEVWAAQADFETEKVVFDAQKDAIEARIKEAAKKPGKGDPAFSQGTADTRRANAGSPDAAPLQDQ